VALHAANQVIETVHTLTYAEVNATSIPATFVAEGRTTDGATLRLTSSSSSAQVGRVAITENPTGTKKTIEVSVTWRGATGSDRTLMLMTEVTNY
jgi:hypothetical protein